MRTLEYSEGCDTTMPHPIKKNVKLNEYDKINLSNLIKSLNHIVKLFFYFLPHVEVILALYVLDTEFECLANQHPCILFGINNVHFQTVILDGLDVIIINLIFLQYCIILILNQMHSFHNFQIIFSL